ncbi:hypothetical protein RCL1_005855 [Eukaryota sp. TZLM3-RCL]
MSSIDPLEAIDTAQSLIPQILQSTMSICDDLATYDDSTAESLESNVRQYNDLVLNVYSLLNSAIDQIPSTGPTLSLDPYFALQLVSQQSADDSS